MNATAFNSAYPTADELAEVVPPEPVTSGPPILETVYRWGNVLARRLGGHIHVSRREETAITFGRLAFLSSLEQAWDKVVAEHQAWLAKEASWAPVVATQDEITGVGLELLEGVQRAARELMTPRGLGQPFGFALTDATEDRWAMVLSDDSQRGVRLLVELFHRDRSAPGRAGTIVRHVESMFAIDMWASPEDRVPARDFLLIVHVRKDKPTQFYVWPYRLHEGKPAEFLELETQHARWIQKGAAMVAAA